MPRLCSPLTVAADSLSAETGSGARAAPAPPGGTIVQGVTGTANRATAQAQPGVSAIAARTA